MIDYTKLLPRTGRFSPIPLVLEDGLYLWDWGIFWQNKLYHTPTRIIKRIVKYFPVAWNQMPEPDRNTLTDFWRSKSQPPGRKPSPAIELNSFCLAPHLRAACRGGYELLLCIEYLDYASPKSIVHTIAHELGHAISHPHGWYKQHNCTARLGECVACECRAYSYMAAWGFDPFYEMLPVRKGKNRCLVDRFAAARGAANYEGLLG